MQCCGQCLMIRKLIAELFHHHTHRVNREAGFVKVGWIYAKVKSGQFEETDHMISDNLSSGHRK